MAAITWAEMLPRTTTDSNGCLLWGGTVNKGGYGHVSRKIESRYRTEDAHRIAYRLNIGPIPKGLCVLHRCDVRRCINPSHLFLGSHKDNSADAMKKGRLKTAFLKRGGRGSNRPPQWVFALREKYAAGGTTHRRLAKEFGLSKSAVGMIITGKRWPTPSSPQQ